MRALVLSGGGSKGSWEAGAVKAVAEKYPDGFEFISGASVGALNCLTLAMYPKEEFQAAAAYAVSVWEDKVQKSSDVWRLRWPLGIPGLWNPSVGVNDALKKLLADIVDPEKVRSSGVRVRMAALDLITGNIHEYSQDSPDPVQGAVSSASFPFVFPPVAVDSRYELDGGIVEMAPLGSAIDAGADEIVVLCCSDPNDIRAVSKEDLGFVYKVGVRVLEVMIRDVIRNDLKVCELYNRLIDAGVESDKKKITTTLICPSCKLHPSLDFTNSAMRAQVRLGYEDAKTILGG